MKVKFNIMNFSKPNSLHNMGMKIMIYSEQKHSTNKTGWFRGGDDIIYFQNHLVRVRTHHLFWS